MRQLWVAVLASVSLVAQTSHTTVRHHREAATDETAALLSRAQEAVERQDYGTAKQLLLQYTVASPDDYRGWYTLAYAESALKERDSAITHYQRALQLKPDFFEANLNVGLLFAQVGRRDLAIEHLEKATRETPSSGPHAKAGAWVALGALHAGEQAKHDYVQALAIDPNNAEAKQALTQPSCPPGYTEAVTKAGTAPPNRSCISNATTATTEELEARVAANANDTASLNLLAHRYIEAREWAKAEPLLKRLAVANPTDANVRFRYGVCLEHLLRSQEAQEELLKAVQLDPKLADAYGDLAVVAAANKNYPLSMKALDYRAKLLPESAGTYFLRATNLDHMQQAKPAAIMYRKFLETAKGESPDNEWQAKHRLIALDPRNETKGKER